MCCWAQYPQVFFVSLGATLESAETLFAKSPFSWFLNLSSQLSETGQLCRSIPNFDQQFHSFALTSFPCLGGTQKGLEGRGAFVFCLLYLRNLSGLSFMRLRRTPWGKSTICTPLWRSLEHLKIQFFSMRFLIHASAFSDLRAASQHARGCGAQRKLPSLLFVKTSGPTAGHFARGSIAGLSAAHSSSLAANKTKEEA